MSESSSVHSPARRCTGLFDSATRGVSCVTVRSPPNGGRFTVIRTLAKASRTPCRLARSSKSYCPPGISTSFSTYMLRLPVPACVTLSKLSCGEDQLSVISLSIVACWTRYDELLGSLML